MFTNLFQTLTKSLSIKGIVISGVVIMGIVVMIFSATMIFFTFTVKYDKETLKTIIVLEEQNNNILKDVNLIHSLNANILTSNSSSFLNKLKVVDTVSNYENLDKKIDIHHKYNDKINELRDVLEQKLLLQKKDKLTRKNMRKA